MWGKEPQVALHPHVQNPEKYLDHKASQASRVCGTNTTLSQITGENETLNAIGLHLPTAHYNGQHNANTRFNWQLPGINYAY